MTALILYYTHDKRPQPLGVKTGRKIDRADVKWVVNGWEN
jgi:hypothetical protein